MIGRTVSRYRIVEKLGAGGMGEVYRAEDSRLGRQVAVKVLPREIASAAEHRARFEREAQAVAALSHPNVLAIHDFGVEGEIAFAVMELLQGETLRAELDRLGALPLRVALERAIQTARGLAAAHAKGIVHRDLKPENLFVTHDGQLKILDFGLAKMVAPGSGAASGITIAVDTQPGTILGTFAYMAPEQTKGAPAGASADLFAFGVILYEMLSGQNPFRRDSVAETISAILRDQAPPLERNVSDLPQAVAHLVRHCLEKNPADRAHSAPDLVYNLEACRAALSAASAPAVDSQAIDSLAVLPFVNESGEPDADYLSDGLAEMIIDNLSQLPRLRVMAQSTVLQVRAQHATPLEIGAALKVRAVLTGRLLLRCDTLIVRAELVDASDGRRLWGGRYDRSHAAALLEIEEQISREISEQLRFQLSQEEKSRIAKRDTEHPEAHHAYLQGR
ncbi:MAG TPA: serine/threonine-protein kinase, partial [Acidobacteriota bacterium]